MLAAMSAEAVRRDQGRITGIVSALPEDQLLAPVPCTPGWTCRMMLCHLVGVPADVAGGRVDGAGTPPWTAAQVEARCERAVQELLDEWAEVAPQLEKMLDGGSPVARTLADIVCHEHDLRGALGRPGARDSEAVDFALQMVIGGLGNRITEAGLPALHLKAENQEGKSGPATRLTQ